MDTWDLQISAGRGPVEVRRFVAALGDALRERCEQAGLRVLEERRAGEDDAGARSVLLRVLGDAEALAWLGTHELLDDARRARSGRHRGHRKRWFAGVSLHRAAPRRSAEDACPALDPGEVELRCDRAGGPGGQHVNTTASAVRARHLPTGLAVRVAEGRSQHQNRGLALTRLAALVAERQRERAAGLRAQRRRAHDQVLRGQAIARWRWTDKRRQRLELVEGSSHA